MAEKKEIEARGKRKEGEQQRRVKTNRRFVSKWLNRGKGKRG